MKRAAWICLFTACCLTEGACGRDSRDSAGAENGGNRSGPPVTVGMGGEAEAPIDRGAGGRDPGGAASDEASETGGVAAPPAASGSDGTGDGGAASEASGCESALRLPSVPSPVIGAFSWAATAADFDGDGAVDLAVSSETDNQSTLCGALQAALESLYVFLLHAGRDAVPLDLTVAECGGRRVLEEVDLLG
jgi:hypothetical protein